MQRTAVDQSEAAALPQLRLPIHALTRQLQAENGLRYSDHQRYRQYCTRRLRKIRKAAGFTHGRGKTFLGKRVTPETATEQLLLIPLLNAERAWSYAMQLKEEYADAKKAAIKAHQHRRYAKAVFWARELQSITAARGDERTRLEGDAYAARMEGGFLMEKEQWEAALEHLTKAQKLYKSLASSGSVEDHDLFVSKLEELAPSIRYCRYNLTGSAGDEGDDELAGLREAAASKEVDELQSKMVEARAHESASHQLRWAGKTVTIRDDQLKVLLVKVRESVSDYEAARTSSTSSEKAIDKKYMRLLSVLGDATREVGDRLNAVSAMSSGVAVESQRQELSSLENYLKHTKLQCMMTRTAGLIKSMQAAADTRPQDLAHLYDAQLQSVRSILTLPGVDEDDIFVLQLGADELIQRGWRAYYLAESYLTEQKWPQALALFEQALELGTQSRERLNDLAPLMEGIPAEVSSITARLEAEVDKLQKSAAGARSRVHALAFLALQSTDEEAQLSEGIQKLSLLSQPPSTVGVDHKPRSHSLLERRNAWVETDTQADAAITSPTQAQKQQRKARTRKGPVTVYDVPPTFEPIPCKPILLDLAANYLEFPNLDKRSGRVSAPPASSSAAAAAAAAEEETTAQSVASSVTSFFGGWFRR